MGIFITKGKPNKGVRILVWLAIVEENVAILVVNTTFISEYNFV